MTDILQVLCIKHSNTNESGGALQCVTVVYLGPVAGFGLGMY
jgi:hypothetical protein